MSQNDFSELRSDTASWVFRKRLISFPSTFFAVLSYSNPKYAKFSKKIYNFYKWLHLFLMGCILFKHMVLDKITFRWGIKSREWNSNDTRCDLQAPQGSIFITQ